MPKRSQSTVTLPWCPLETAPVSPDIPPLHQSDLVLDEHAIIQLSAGFGRIRRDQVDLLVPRVLREGDRGERGGLLGTLLPVPSPAHPSVGYAFGEI